MSRDLHKYKDTSLNIWSLQCNLTSILLQVWCPESEIISKKLHNESAVFVWLFTQGVKLCNCFIKCLFCQMARSAIPARKRSFILFLTRLAKAIPKKPDKKTTHTALKWFKTLMPIAWTNTHSPLRWVENLIVEDWEIQCKTQPNWVCRCQICNCCVWSSLHRVSVKE